MARRNANGEGTIYRRKDGRWVGSVSVQAAGGKRKRVYCYGKTRAEASKELTKLKSHNDQGIPTTDKNWLLGDYLDYWLAEVVEPTRKPTTYDLYESNIRRYLKPDIGHISLVKLSVPTLQRYLNQQLANGKTVRKVQTLREVLSSAFTRAMREELLSRNVARLVEVREAHSNEAETFEPWTPKEARQFLTAAAEHKWFPAFLVSTLYGLRRGEVLGLRWEDIDFVKRVIRVRQQVFRARGRVQVGPVKTRAGVRDLPLLQVVGQVLQYWSRQHGHDLEGLVFTTSARGPIEPQNYTRAFLRICARHQIRRIRLHDERHGTATLLADLGVPDKDIQRIMGHSNISITQKIYMHGRLATRREAMNLAGDVLLTPEILAAVGVKRPMLVSESDSSENDSARLGSCQNGCQTTATPSLVSQFNSSPGAKNKPATGATVAGWLDEFLGDLTGNRTRIARMKSQNMPVRRCMHERVTEVDTLMHARRKAWMLGVVAVSVAVKGIRGDETELSA
ncbi:site-specific integrase [Streptomyces sp. DvalAA-19]|uniref:tyrosine-type recombinase/integrase n=1 Tax=Streptomyces sp. DvalAA-19 TaxID=1839761 RepID=UPI00081B27BC|nr:site-specific integrase [Streptomyces sp. DvalAA-19]SCD56710.1 Site-specific recombinase XerD [Streptomyces sp. DvalAA-19]